VTVVLHFAVPDGHEWLRVTDPAWDDPIDASHSVAAGGRWNPPGTWAALYLNHDLDTARFQILRMLEGTPFEPGDLADDAYDLITVTLPDAQTALDVVSDRGVAAVGLPITYPAASERTRVPHEDCWPIATDAHRAGLDAEWR
jgi:RES domain-containing protein